MTRIITFMIIASFPLLGLAQELEREVVATGGNYSSNSNMSLSYTIGEPMIETYEQTNIVLTQGFQQAKTDTFVGIPGKGPQMSIRAYPNPTADVVLLEISSDKKLDVRLDVYDIAGKKQALPAESLTLKGQQVKKELNFADLAAGNYFIRLISEKGQKLETIKVQKIR